MALYSFESAASRSRIARKVIVADSSYLISLNHTLHKYSRIVNTFHSSALSGNAEFWVNVTVRHEFISYVRYGLLIKTLSDMVTIDPSLEARFRSIYNSRPVAGSDLASFIQKNAEPILKDFIKAGDYARILSLMTRDIWAEWLLFENTAGVTYLSGSSKDSWAEFGKLIAQYWIEPPDAMIVNFANYIEADAIVTADVGFAIIANVLDVYMPRALAIQCVGIYDPAKDI